MSLDEMQARCDAATPDWQLDSTGLRIVARYPDRQHRQGASFKTVAEFTPPPGSWRDEAEHNCAFAAHARTDMPRLIAALRVAMEALDGIESGADSFPPHRSAREALARVAAILEVK